MMNSRSGCGLTESDSTRGASGWSGSVCISKLRSSSPAASCFFLRSPCSFSVDLLAVGFRHVDVGQHLFDRVAAFQAQGQIVAHGGRSRAARLFGGRRRASSGIPGTRPMKSAARFGSAGHRRRAAGTAVAWMRRPLSGGGAAISGSSNAPSTRAAQREQRGADGEAGQAGTVQKRRIWHFSTGPTERGNPS